MQDIEITVSVSMSMSKLKGEIKHYMVKPNEKVSDLKKVINRDFNRMEDEKLVLMLADKLKALNDEQTIAEAIQGSNPNLKIIFPKKQNPPARSSFIFRPDKLIAEPPVDDKYLKVLEQLGYPPEECKKALIASFNNVDKAAEYLIHGNIPQQRFSGNRSRRSTQSERSRSCTSDEEGQKPKEHIKLESKDIAVLNQLKNEGFDEKLIIQIYFACDRNEQQTRELLKNMK